jgi:hypothetical protein
LASLLQHPPLEEAYTLSPGRSADATASDDFRKLEDVMKRLLILAAMVCGLSTLGSSSAKAQWGYYPGGYYGGYGGYYAPYYGGGYYRGGWGVPYRSYYGGWGNRSFYRGGYGWGGRGWGGRRGGVYIGW